MSRIFRRQQNADSIVVRNAVIMEDKVLGQRLLAQPLDRLRRGIKSMHVDTKLAYQLEIKRNVLSNSTRIDHAGSGQTVRANAPLCAFVSQPQFCAVHLSPLPEVSPAECADNALEIPVRIDNHAPYGAINIEKGLKRDSCFLSCRGWQGSIPHERPGLISELGSAWRAETK